MDAWMTLSFMATFAAAHGHAANVAMNDSVIHATIIRPRLELPIT